MKRLVFTLIVVFICSVSYSQSGWYQVYIPPAGKSIHSIQFTSENTGYASLYNWSGTGYGGLLKTTNGGVNWVNITPTGNAWDFCFLDDNTGYVDFWNTNLDHILKTTNGGINWVDQDSVYQLLGIEFFDYNTGFAATKYGGGKKTTNGGIKWIPMGNGCWHQWTTMSFLSADKWLVACGYICRTTNGGMNWTSSDYNYEAIYFINSTTGFVGGSDGAISKTTNAGDNWFAIDTIASISFPKNIMFVNENTGYLSAHYNQVYKTTNGGYNWSQQVIDSNYIEYVHFINPNTGFAGGGNGAIYKTTTGGTVFVNNISTEVPSAYSLGKNYPNPFNPVTKIKFSVVSSPRGLGGDLVLLKVYDITGREVQTLVNERLQAGTYETTFDGSMLNSGVYFYQLVSGTFKETKRMLLVK